MKRIFLTLALFFLLINSAWAAEPAARFSDVSQEDWFAPYVEVCTEAGLIQGVGEEKFEPECALTLAEAISLTVRMEGVLHQSPAPLPLPQDLYDLIRFYDQDGVLLGNWSIASQVVQPGAPDVLLVSLDPGLHPEKLTMRLELEALRQLGAIYSDTDQSNLSGRYDPQQKLWLFETKDFWMIDTLELLAQLPPVWYRDDLLAARRLGALAGFDEEAFAALWPDRFDQTAATRLDLARMVSSVTDAQDLWPPLTITPPPDTQDEAVVKLYSFGILNGIDETGTFAGELPLTRGQAAAIFARVLQAGLRQRPPVSSKTPDQLTSIQVSHGSFGFVDTEFLVDLNSGRLWTFSADPWTGEAERDPDAEHQGFQASRPLEPQKIASFREAPPLQGLLTWSGSYVAPAFDGHQWRIILTFSDGEVRQIFGSNAYPAEWDELYDALRALTGENILEVRSDWIDWPDE